jgi:hypothetical protein
VFTGATEGLVVDVAGEGLAAAFIASMYGLAVIAAGLVGAGRRGPALVDARRRHDSAEPGATVGSPRRSPRSRGRIQSERYPSSGLSAGAAGALPRFASAARRVGLAPSVIVVAGAARLGCGATVTSCAGRERAVARLMKTRSGIREPRS